jgi:phosphatidylinositol 4-phosphatase
MDCLDRTNVVQSVFSRKVLHQQLHEMGLADKPSGAPFETFKDDLLERAFKDAWTDNADAISILYTGTPALKTDFTRTGKRTYLGALNDAKNSLTRYYINNFCDGYNHDCLDLAQGRLTATSKLKRHGWVTPFKFAVVVMLAFEFALYNLLSTYVPYPSEEEGQRSVHMLHSLYYLLLALSFMLYVFKNGKSFVNDATRVH